MANESRFYEDIVIGETRESTTRVVALDELIEFASRYDPQYFHVDPNAAERSVFRGITASGIHTAALWRALGHQINGDIRWICGLAWKDAQWPNPVRAGDTLRARSEALNKRPSRSHPERGVVEFRYILFNQRDEIAFSCQSVSLIEMRPVERPVLTACENEETDSRGLILEYLTGELCVHG
jgi:acyl dehydratase